MNEYVRLQVPQVLNIKPASTVIERPAPCGLLQIWTFRMYLLPPPYEYSIHVTASSQTITSV